MLMKSDCHDFLTRDNLFNAAIHNAYHTPLCWVTICPVKIQMRSARHAEDMGTKSFLERTRKRVVAARQEVEKAKDAVVIAEGKLALEKEEVRKAETRLFALQPNHTPTNPLPTVPADFAQC